MHIAVSLSSAYLIGFLLALLQTNIVLCDGWTPADNHQHGVDLLCINTLPQGNVDGRETG